MRYGMRIEKKGLLRPFFLHQPTFSTVIIQLSGVNTLNLENQPGWHWGKILLSGIDVHKPF